MSGRKQFDVDAALDRAMQVFWRQGYADASLDLLGSATGLGRGSLYGAFGGKDALFRQCLDRYGSTYGAQYGRALAAYPDEPVRAVEAFFDVVLERIADPAVPDGCLIAQSASQSSGLTEESRTRVQALLGDQRKRVRAALSRPSASSDLSAPSAAEIDSAEMDGLAVFVVAVTQSLAVLSRAGTPDADLRSVARIACTTVADTLAQAKSEGTRRS